MDNVSMSTAAMKRVQEINSLLHDCVQEDDPSDGTAYQVAGLSNLANLLQQYEQRIEALESRIAEVEENRR